MTDTYVIDVQDLGNALDVLMFVLAIDAEKCTRNKIIDLVTVIIRRMKHGIIQKENREKNI